MRQAAGTVGPTRVRSVQPTDLKRFPSEVARRISMTVSCSDADEIPKVEDAGGIREIGGQRAQVMHNGVLVTEGGYYGEWMVEVIRALRGHHEPQEERVFHEIVNRLKATADGPQVMIEFGAFWSYYSLWFCHALLGSRAIAIEPDPAWIEVGRQNAALNRLSDRVRFIQAAIGDQPGKQMLFRSESDLQERYVDQCDLASVLESEHLERVDLVLSDVQGAETILLDRGKNWLAEGRVRFLFVSTHHHSISGNALTHQQALRLLIDLGAHVICEHSVSESLAGDGLIAVSFAPSDRDLVVEVSRARSKDSLFGEVEYDLANLAELVATAKSDTANKQAELNDLRRQLAEAQRAEAILTSQVATTSQARNEAASELDRMRQTKLWRWSRAPRAIYAAIRSR